MINLVSSLRKFFLGAIVICVTDHHGYGLFVVVTIPYFFPLSWRMSYNEQELLTHTEHVGLLPVFFLGGALVTHLCVVFLDSIQHYVIKFVSDCSRSVVFSGYSGFLNQ